MQDAPLAAAQLTVDMLAEKAMDKTIKVEHDRTDLARAAFLDKAILLA